MGRSPILQAGDVLIQLLGGLAQALVIDPAPFLDVLLQHRIEQGMVKGPTLLARLICFFEADGIGAEESDEELAGHRQDQVADDQQADAKDKILDHQPSFSCISGCLERISGCLERRWES